MSFEMIARQYLSDLQQEVKRAYSTGEFTPELSYRILLDDFFGKVAGLISPEVARIFEPRIQAKAGRPDWRFYNASNLGIYGYAEAKGLNMNAPLVINTYRGQVDKYLKLGLNVVLTDGIDFIFFDAKTRNAERLFLINKPILASDRKDLAPNLLLEAKFRSFFQDAGFRRISEAQLIKEMALRAIELSKSIEELADSPLGSGLDTGENTTIEVLHQLKFILENHHDPVLRTSKAFADFVAQVLVFGLLYAHRVVVGVNDTPKDRDLKMQQFWLNTVVNEQSERLRPFRALIEMLGPELFSLSRIGVWYGDCRLLLAHVALEETQRRTPDYHILYERFLSVFDSQTRFDYGAFYTPHELAEFAVLMTQAIVEVELPGVSLYEPGNKLIDPCCGTGTFLEQLIVHAQHGLNQGQVIGFEILPAPYALAHYRLSMIGVRPDDLQNLSIILTNTLCDELELEQVSAPQNLIDEEQSAARKLAKPPLTLVIGNPPSSDTSPHTAGQNFTIIETLLGDFRPPAERRTRRQNTQKQLQNDFIKFLRWACDKLLSNNTSLFTLILPSSFAEQPSYIYTRKWLTEHFHKLWVLDLDLDARTGVRASSLFNTLQGRLLLIGLKLPYEHTGRAKIFYHSIASLTKQQKVSELTLRRNANAYLSMFTPISLDETMYLFRSSKPFDNAIYSRFWALYPVNNESMSGERCIFQRHNSCIKLGASSLFVHPNAQVLLRRCRDIANERNSVSALKQKWFLDQDKPPADRKFSQSFRREVELAVRVGEEAIRTYAYRPLLNLFALFSEPVIREFSTVSSGTRVRPEVLHAFQDEKTIGIAVAPAPKDIGEQLHRFASFCWTMPDNDLCKRGNAHVFCNQFPEYWRRNNWNPTPVGNINPDLLQRLGTVVKSPSREDIVFYAYGVLCSDAFLDAFEGALHTVANVVPRIPIPADAALFRSITDKGKKLADLEKPSAEINLPDRFNELRDLFVQPFKLVKYHIDENVECINLLDLNGQITISIKPISREVLEFKVSGYQVIDQWLKFYSHRYTQMEFTQAQYVELLKLLHRIELQIHIVRELDSDIAGILASGVQLL